MRDVVEHFGRHLGVDKVDKIKGRRGETIVAEQYGSENRYQIWQTEDGVRASIHECLPIKIC